MEKEKEKEEKRNEKKEKTKWINNKQTRQKEIKPI